MTNKHKNLHLKPRKVHNDFSSWEMVVQGHFPGKNSFSPLSEYAYILLHRYGVYCILYLFC